MLTGEEPSPQHARAVEQYLMLDRRPRVQRLDLHRPGDRLHGRRRRRLPGRRPRCALRAAARRRAEPGPGHPGRDRHPGPDRPLDPAAGAGRRPDHGLRPRRLPHRGPALADAARGRGVARGRGRRGRAAGHAGRAGRAPGGRDPGRAQTGPRAAHQRRVLRGGGDGAVRAAARDVHPHVRRRPGGRLVGQRARTGPRQQDHPARRPGTSARRRPSPCRPAEDVAARTSRRVRRPRVHSSGRRRGPRWRPTLGVGDA